MAVAVGIDLGTTNSLCAVFDEHGPRLLPNVTGRVLTPSVVGVLADGSILVGDAASELRIVDPDRTVACFKRWMGTDRVAQVDAKSFTAQELSALVLRSLKTDAEHALNESVSEAVITVPAYFNDLQRQATRIAGKLAGLKVRRILNEPSAAALTYGLLDRQADKRLLVFDLGGGTFDVTLMEVFEGTLEIVATAGESHLGGEDFTERMIAWVLQQQGMQLEPTELREPRRFARLRQQAESAKRRLGETAQVTFPFPTVDGTLEPDGPRVEIDRATYAELMKPLLDRLLRPMVKVLRDGRTAASDIEEVVLAGGATRDPFVRALVADYFEREPLCSVDPDEVVAKGAAIQTALLAEHAAVEDVVVTDVCPFTLGIAIAKKLGNRYQDGYFLPLIHRNTTIPVSREEIVSTVEPNQTQVDVQVYQGESRRAGDNLLLGSLKVVGIPPGPAGQDLAVRFTYDINGLLEVETVVEETGRKFSAVFTHNVHNLSEDEIERALESLQRLKFYPREDLENKRLLLYAERVLGQVPPHARQILEAALDAYESALHDTDRTTFEGAHGYLIRALSELDHPYDAETGE